MGHAGGEEKSLVVLSRTNREGLIEGRQRVEGAEGGSSEGPWARRSPGKEKEQRGWEAAV